jgi:hypothetical protein
MLIHISNATILEKMKEEFIGNDSKIIKEIVLYR